MTSDQRCDPTRHGRCAARQRRAQLDALVEEAIVDCDGEDEQITGL